MATAPENRVDAIVKDAKSNETKVRRVMEKCDKAHEELQTNIDTFIEVNSRRTIGAPLCVNTRTKVTHNVLPSIQSAGNEARTWCMWKYAKCYVRLADEPGTSGYQPCDECYLELTQS